LKETLRRVVLPPEGNPQKGCVASRRKPSEGLCCLQKETLRRVVLPSEGNPQKSCVASRRAELPPEGNPQKG